MKRLVLRKGFTLRAHEGVGHLTDVRTGDALLVPGSDLVLLEAAALNGLDPAEPAVAVLLTRYGLFLEPAPEATDRAFYELDLDDAPTIPPVRAEEVERPRVVATVATPSAASSDWQLHGDAQKRAESPSPLPQPDPDNPWKVRESSAPVPARSLPSIFSLPAPGSSESPVPVIPPVRPSPSADSGARRASPSGRWPAAASSEPGASSESPVPAIPPVRSSPSADSGARRASPSGRWPAAASSEPSASSEPPVRPSTSADSGARRASPSGRWPAASSASSESPVPAIPPVRPSPSADSGARRASPSGRWPAAASSELGVNSESSAPSVRPSPSGTSSPAPADPMAPWRVATPTGASLAASTDLSAAEELSRALAASERELNQTAREPTSDGRHLEQVLASGSSASPPTAEDELRHALEAAQQPPAPTAPPVTTDPANFLSQEDNLRNALDQASAPTSHEDIAALLESTAKELGVTAPSAPTPTDSPQAPAQPGRAATLVAAGVAVLALTVAVSLWLRARPDADDLDTVNDAGTPSSAVTTKLPDAGAGLTGAAKAGDADAGDAGVLAAGAKTDAGVLAAAKTDGGVAAKADAGVLAAVKTDAGVVASLVDAGTRSDVALAAKPADAGVAPKSDGWLEGPVQARGRVKMADLKARADGTVTWSVPSGQRVKAKQVIGKLTRADGSTQDLVAESVGLAMLDVSDGALVKAAAPLAQVIYFEAWGKAVVKGLPTPAWRCEVASESAGQRAECKVSVVTPRPGGGAQVTVAIEPRWFDGAADAVVRLAP